MADSLKNQTIQKLNAAIYRIGTAVHQQNIWKKNQEDALKDAEELNILILKLNQEEAQNKPPVKTEKKPEPAHIKKPKP